MSFSFRYNLSILDSVKHYKIEDCVRNQKFWKPVSALCFCKNLCFSAQNWYIVISLQKNTRRNVIWTKRRIRSYAQPKLSRFLRVFFAILYAYILFVIVSIPATHSFFKMRWFFMECPSTTERLLPLSLSEIHIKVLSWWPYTYDICPISSFPRLFSTKNARNRNVRVRVLCPKCCNITGINWKTLRPIRTLVHYFTYNVHVTEILRSKKSFLKTIVQSFFLVLKQQTAR